MISKTKNLKQEPISKDFDLGYLAANGDELFFEMGRRG